MRSHSNPGWEYCTISWVDAEETPFWLWLLELPKRIFLGAEFRWIARDDSGRIIAQSGVFRANEDLRITFYQGPANERLTEMQQILEMRGWQRMPGEEMRMRR